MYLLLGNSHMERSDYQRAVQSFEYARSQMRYMDRSLLVISLVSFLMGVSQRIEIADQR